MHPLDGASKRRHCPTFVSHSLLISPPHGSRTRQYICPMLFFGPQYNQRLAEKKRPIS